MVYKTPLQRFGVRRHSSTEPNNPNQQADDAHHYPVRGFATRPGDFPYKEHDPTRPFRDHCRAPSDFRYNAESTTRHSPWGGITKPHFRAIQPPHPLVANSADVTVDHIDLGNSSTLREYALIGHNFLEALMRRLDYHQDTLRNNHFRHLVTRNGYLNPAVGSKLDAIDDITGNPSNPDQPPGPTLYISSNAQISLAAALKNTNGQYNRFLAELGKNKELQMGLMRSLDGDNPLLEAMRDRYMTMVDQYLRNGSLKGAENLFSSPPVDPRNPIMRWLSP